jgi:hypothetical protein
VQGKPVWDMTGYSGVMYTGDSMPMLVQPIPPYANIARVIFHMVVGGSRDSAESGDFRQPQGLFLFNNIYVQTALDPGHRIYESYDIVPVQFATLFDSSLDPISLTNRYFYGVYQAGDRELGCNLKVSFGGPLEPEPMKVWANPVLRQLGNNVGPEFQVAYAVYMRTLSYQV